MLTCAVDEGWLKGRYPGNNTIYEDLEKFPQGETRGAAEKLQPRAS